MERTNNSQQPLVPAALVAAEVSCSINELAVRLGGGGRH